jgi:hypothetical protein
MNEENNLQEKGDDSEPLFEVDQKDYSKYLSYCKSKENLVMAIIGVVMVSVVVVALWPVLVKFTGYKVGWMALVQGFAAGYAVKKLGKGISPGFGILAGIITFLIWLAGNLLTACVIFSKIKNVSFFSILTNMDVPSAFDFLKAFLGPIDFLIGIAAVYAAYYLGFKRLQPPQ